MQEGLVRRHLYGDDRGRGPCRSVAVLHQMLALESQCQRLVEDCYGNYIIQHAIKVWSAHTCKEVIAVGGSGTPVRRVLR